MWYTSLLLVVVSLVRVLDLGVGRVAL